MELNQDTGSGRNVPLEAEVARELTAEDIIVRESLAVSSKTPLLKKLRASHHRLAHLLACGTAEGDAAMMTGYAPSRISILKNDPAFKDLMAFYADGVGKIEADVTQRMADLAIDMVEVLQDRLDENPSQFTAKDLNNLIKTAADRGGHSPINRSETRTLVLTAEDLNKIKGEVQANQNGHVRKINQADEAASVRAFLQGDTRSPLSADDNGPSGLVIEQAAITRGESPGHNL